MGWTRARVEEGGHIQDKELRRSRSRRSPGGRRRNGRLLALPCIPQPLQRHAHRGSMARPNHLGAAGDTAPSLPAVCLIERNARTRTGQENCYFCRAL